MVGPGAFMITVTFHGYSVKSYRDHESVALAPHGWAVFRRGAGHTAAVGPRAKGTPVSDLTARSRRGKARKSSRPPVEVGTMDLRRLGNKPAGSTAEYKDAQELPPDEHAGLIRERIDDATGA